MTSPRPDDRPDAPTDDGTAAASPAADGAPVPRPAAEPAAAGEHAAAGPDTSRPEPHTGTADTPADRPDGAAPAGRDAEPARGADARERHPAVTPADVADAARLVSFGLQPKLLPARDLDYGELVRRYRDDPSFSRLADSVATGLGLVVLEVSARAGMALTAAEDSVFAVRLGEYSRRAAAESSDRFLHGLAHLAIAALAFPRPEDLADDGYVGRFTVNGVDAFVRQACRRLEERAARDGDNTDPRSDAPGLEAGWRAYARRTATGATKDARRLSGSTTGIIGKAVSFLADSGFLQKAGDDGGGTYRTTARYQLQVRDMAGSAALTELLELGVVPVSDGSATLLPPDDDLLDDPAALPADAGLPFHAL